MNLMGGSFCSGAEVNWVMRNPAIYLEPFRLKADPEFSSFRQTAANANQNSRTLTVPESDYASYVEDDLSQGSDFRTGLQPGDLTSTCRSRGNLTSTNAPRSQSILPTICGTASTPRANTIR